MHKVFLQTAAVLGALAVALGAFGAHKLKTMVSADAVSTFETGVRYQFYHVIALLLAGILYSAYPNRFVNLSGWLFVAGIVLFSGSLYLLTYKLGANHPGLGWAGPLTPLGGLCFVAGWICLALGIGKG